MGRWTIKPPVVYALLTLLFLVLLILVLPGVDLPDAAFHGGTAPVLLNARSITPPSLLVLSAFILFSMFSQTLLRRHVKRITSSYVSVESLSILHQSLRC
jgi:hypothetical protein